MNTLKVSQKRVGNQLYFEDKISIFNTPFDLAFRPNLTHFLVYTTDPNIAKTKLFDTCFDCFQK